MLFDEVQFTELDRDASEDLVEKYREEGQKNLPPPEPSPPPVKRFKDDDYKGRSMCSLLRLYDLRLFLYCVHDSSLEYSQFPPVFIIEKKLMCCQSGWYFINF